LNTEKVNNIFHSFSSKKVLVIGDVMVDSYLWGKVDRISPEAPVPIVACSKRESRLGGAANVALNLASLEATPILCGIIGNDDNGTLFLKLMQENHLTNSGIFIVKHRPTTVKTRIIGGNQQLMRIDEETDKAIEGKYESHFIEHILKVIAKEPIDAIIFQDYDKGTLTPKVISEIISIAQKKKIPTLVDPKKRNFMNFQGVTLFKPNFKEYCEGMKIDLPKDNFPKIFESAREFLMTLNIEYLLLTLSEKGVFICDKDKYYHHPAHLRDITDVSGAGDTVVSTASLCLTTGLHPNVIAAISNLAGGLVCEKVGVVPLNKLRLQEETILLDLEEFH
jgi:D-glycero-beta-D-manno-heptose-7-phosphate kinase